MNKWKKEVGKVSKKIINGTTVKSQFSEVGYKTAK